MKLTDEQKQRIGELVGSATMQWDPIPTGVFMSTEASAIVDKIIKVAEGEV